MEMEEYRITSMEDEENSYQTYISLKEALNDIIKMDLIDKSKEIKIWKKVAEIN